MEIFNFILHSLQSTVSGLLPRDIFGSLISSLASSFDKMVRDTDAKFYWPFQGWRVEDEDSRTSYQEGEGILSESDHFVPLYTCNPDEEQELCDEVLRHCDWKNRSPTPFISIYADKDHPDQAYAHARAAAERRVRKGRRNVVIYEVYITEQDHDEYGFIGYRNVEKLMKRFQLEVPPDAKHEFIFLHCIPEEMIISEERFD